MRHTTRRALRAARTAGEALAAYGRGPLSYLAYLLNRAAKTGRTVVIDYVKENGEASTRTIQPTGEVTRSKAGHLYIRAVDQFRGGADRTFRLARITHLETA
jgi:predicted DNA-binding transcriptional regulator YafY